MNMRTKVVGLDVIYQGDTTTTGGTVLEGVRSFFDQNHLLALKGHQVFCPACKQTGFIAQGSTALIVDTRGAALDGYPVVCGCKPDSHRLIASQSQSSVAAALAAVQAATLSRQPPAQAAGWREDKLAYAASERTGEAAINPAQRDTEEKPLPLPLPALIYQTRRKMDDYAAPDLRCGDLTAEQLINHFQLRDVSARTFPYLMADRQASAKILFDEFRTLSDAFSFHGDYQGLMRKMINHMQANTGAVFSDPLLDQAMAERILEDKSENSSLEKVRGVLRKHIDRGNGIFPLKWKEVFHNYIMNSILPKFNNLSDRVNGLGISVHDVWSVNITLKALEISGDRYKAKVHYHIQDHFGLDDTDITDSFYKQLRIFRIWFVLQRWQEYGYKPFITEMNVEVTIEGAL